ncbi:DNA recombination and repair protein RecO [hydrothermal vent metagenome]|uniref:DNA repair protein RecO n=1 Tax=hydrothermal vent metagenome TaxID=652676 RepID=A0A3B0YWU0_9ZZZZ
MRKQRNSQSGWILSTRAYRDTSVIADCFSLNYGRVSMIAKGAKQSRSRYRGLLQPFYGIQLSWIEGNSDLFTLIDIEELPQVTVPLAGTALYCGFYINELMTRLLHLHDPHPRLYGVYSHTLQQLMNCDDSTIKHILRIFEKRMLQSIGYALVLNYDTESGEAIQADSLYHYIPEVGPVACRKSDAGFKLHGSTLLALDSEQQMDANGENEGRHLLRFMLKYYLGEKPLKSRELLHNDY